MNVLIYSEDLEPITHIDLPWVAWEELQVWNQTHIQVRDPKHAQPPQVLHLELQWLPHPTGPKAFVVTQQEQLALDLHPQPLPGQRRIWQWPQRP